MWPTLIKIKRVCKYNRGKEEIVVTCEIMYLFVCVCLRVCVCVRASVYVCVCVFVCVCVRVRV